MIASIFAGKNLTNIKKFKNVNFLLLFSFICTFCEYMLDALNTESFNTEIESDVEDDKVNDTTIYICEFNMQAKCVKYVKLIKKSS